MKKPPCTNVLAFLALGCVLPPSAAEPRQELGAAGPEPGEERTLRFGDPAGAYNEPFFPGAEYDAALTTPDAVLGQEHGSRLAHHAEIVAAFRRWDEESDRLTLHEYGRTHEGRELVYGVITSPENHAALASIQADLARLHDPRGLSDAEAERILAATPACAWMGYSIHGDELSGADASLAVAYHLLAGTGAEVQALLERLVIVVDPCMNPDGRERMVSMVEQMAGYVPNLDYASLQRGRWPFGRGNHYQFDMNRDWMAGTQPETRGRWRVALAFHPQLFVDAHEMGSLDTFLFYPQNRPLNPELPPRLGEWQRRYAEGAARAFDARGWSYYTREWADAWAPFYSDAWGSLIGATGMLYEQARTDGFPLRRASGELLTYRESVHHQAVASLANLATLAESRREALEAYLENARRNVAADTPDNDRMFVVPPQANADRFAELVRILRGQEIEFVLATESFEAAGVVGADGSTVDQREFPAGSLVVQARQPARQRVRAFLAFDPRMPNEDLVRERRSLEREGETLIYDLTSWCLPFALDLESYWCTAAAVAGDAEVAGAPEEPRFVGPADPVGWVVSGADDASLPFAVRAMEAGLAVHVVDIELPVAIDGDAVELPRGTLLVRAVEHPGRDAGEAVARAARAAGVRTVYRVGTGLTPDASSVEAPDLGGGHFRLLARPRVALLANAPVAEDTFGHLWFHLDHELGVPLTMLDAHSLGYYDLRRYNVLVVPPGGVRSVLEENLDALRGWVEDGGTLIACGDAAAALTAGELGLSAVRLRRHALDDLTPYRIAQRREWDAREIEVDDVVVWGDAPPEAAAEPEDPEDEEEDPYAAEEVPEEHDAWLRTFAPYGVTLRGIVDRETWVTFGARDELPVYSSGGSVFLSKAPVRTAVRLAEEDRLRLGGLVWPEARERLAGSAWLTVESSGNGQIVLFASLPAFRGYHEATARLFANAVVLGPGAGANPPTAW